MDLRAQLTASVDLIDAFKAAGAASDATAAVYDRLADADQGRADPVASLLDAERACDAAISRLQTARAAARTARYRLQGVTPRSADLDRAMRAASDAAILRTLEGR